MKWPQPKTWWSSLLWIVATYVLATDLLPNLLSSRRELAVDTSLIATAWTGLAESTHPQQGRDPVLSWLRCSSSEGDCFLWRPLCAVGDNSWILSCSSLRPSTCCHGLGIHLLGHHDGGCRMDDCHFFNGRIHRSNLRRTLGTADFCSLGAHDFLHAALGRSDRHSTAGSRSRRVLVDSPNAAKSGPHERKD